MTEKTGELPDLTGQWDTRLVTTSTARLPVLGEIMTTQTSRLTVNIAQRGDEIRLRVRVCEIDVETDSSMVSMTIPSAFVESLEVVERSGRIEEVGEGVRLVVPPVWSAQGVELADPTRDQLPEDEDDPRVIDQDGDGNPGLTIRVGGVVSGEVYVVQRGWDAWSGTIRGDEIRGHVQWEDHQVVLGASSRWLRRGPDARPLEDPERNRFQMKRLDGDESPRC